MHGELSLGVALAVISGLMNGGFTMPMRFLGKWEWENVWSLFIAGSCLVLPAGILALTAPESWTILAHAPQQPVVIALVSGFAWGFGAIMFGQSVSAIGISLANTLVLAISSALGSFLPMLILAPERLMEHTGRMIMLGVGLEILAISMCGWAGRMREQSAGVQAERGELVGKARPVRVALLLASGAGVLSAVFNIRFTLASPIAASGRAAGLSEFKSVNLIWWLMLGSGSVANLIYCALLFRRNESFKKFSLPGGGRLFTLAALMALLWGGSIFVYGAAAPKLGSLGTAIGWPLSLSTGLLLANAIGIALGEWRQAPESARRWMYSGIAVLLIAILVLSRAN